MDIHLKSENLRTSLSSNFNPLVNAEYNKNMAHGLLPYTALWGFFYERQTRILLEKSAC